MLRDHSKVTANSYKRMKVFSKGKKSITPVLALSVTQERDKERFGTGLEVYLYMDESLNCQLLVNQVVDTLCCHAVISFS